MKRAFMPRLREVAREHGFALDAAQERVATAFERLERELTFSEHSDSGLLRWFRRPAALKGIYLWGPVGRGKSFLMDAFFRLTRIERKRRVHFHRFMQEVHHRLRILQGQPDPLRMVAQDFGALERKHPRFTAWRRDWAHRFEALQPVATSTGDLPTLLLADRQAIHLLDRERWRARWLLQPAERRSWLEQYEAIAQRCEAAWPPTTLGL